MDKKIMNYNKELADLLGALAPVKVRTIKPSYVPLPILRSTTEGIEPVLQTSYRRWFSEPQPDVIIEPVRVLYHSKREDCT